MEEIKHISLQVAKGIHYLHKSKIVHHDIKLEHILLNNNLEAKLCDFGTAARMEKGKSLKICEGTLGYAAPEGI